MRPRVVSAVFRRDIVGYFSSPTGYVFITVFLLLCGFFLLWPVDFFRDNLANLKPLNDWFPVLMLFLVPAITMSTWADEKRQGVDELLLTLPVTELEIVVGKYLSALGIYTASLGFAVAYVVLLVRLGSPDPGLMLSNFFAYWMLGAALLAVGMVGSAVTENLTVGFILGAVFCAVPVFATQAAELAAGESRFWLMKVLGWPMKTILAPFGARPRFVEMTQGVVSLSNVAYFAGIAATMLLLNLYLLGRRRSRVPLYGVHAGVRTAALAVATASLAILVGRLPLRLDLTAERLHSLSPTTRKVISEVDPEKPVFVQAFVSKEVPRGYVETRENLLNMLREIAAIGGARVRVNVIETERYTEEARRAEEDFGIKAEEVNDEQGGQSRQMHVFLGVAVTCGADEVVTPFFYQGLSIEYELTRSIRTVARRTGARLKAGILETDAKVFGGFDMQSFQSSPEWEFVRELKKQYDVVKVPADQPYPADLAVLIAVLPSSLAQPQMDTLRDWVRKGKPTLLIDDPFPMAVPGGTPSEPKGGNRNPFMQQGPPPEERGRIGEVMTIAGFKWRVDEIVWDKYNPHPRFAGLDPEIVFCGPGNGASAAFNANEPTTAGLQEVVFIHGGCIEPSGAPGVNFIELLKSGRNSGIVAWKDLMERSFMGSRINPRRKHLRGDRELTLAARTSGTVNVIFIADVDSISETFFDIRRRGHEDLSLDNVTFVLNCVDQLAGDDTFIELRKRRRKHRTLDALEARLRQHTERQLQETRDADDAAQKSLDAAQKRFEEKVKEVDTREDLDELTKQIMAEQIRQVEQRRLDSEKKKIEADKSLQIDRSKGRTDTEIRDVQSGIKWMGLVFPPLPAIALAITVFVIRRRRERGMAAGDRWVGGGTGATS